MTKTATPLTKQFAIDNSKFERVAACQNWHVFATRLESDRARLIELVKEIQRLDYFQEHSGLANKARALLRELEAK